MKRFFSHILVFITVVLGSLPTTMAFTMPAMSEDMEMWNAECSQIMQMDCEEENHDCCLSPFIDGANQTNIQNSITLENHNIVDIDIDFFAILQENLSRDFLKQSNAPPLYNNPLIIKSYSQLIGIIKSTT